VLRMSINSPSSVCGMITALAKASFFDVC
jgi:hypothetical protein